MLNARSPTPHVRHTKALSVTQAQAIHQVNLQREADAEQRRTAQQQRKDLERQKKEAESSGRMITEYFAPTGLEGT